MSESDACESELKWAGIVEEYRRDLSCVCKKIAQAIGWQPRRLCKSHAPKLDEQRQKAMGTNCRGGICLHQAMKTVKRAQRREGEHVLATLG